jgi:hypothetical protein
VGGGPSEHARFLSGERGKRAGRRDSEPFRGQEIGKIGPNHYTRGRGLGIEPSFHATIPSANQTAKFAHLAPNSNSEPRFNATKHSVSVFDVVFLFTQISVFSRVRYCICASVLVLACVHDSTFVSVLARVRECTYVHVFARVRDYAHTCTRAALLVLVLYM